MSKLFNLKQWVTIDEAAEHLSRVLSEPVTSADVLRLALNEQIVISVNFVNGAYARKGKKVPASDADFILTRKQRFIGPSPELFRKFDGDRAAKNMAPATNTDHIADAWLDYKNLLSHGHVLEFQKETETIWGIWDLPMVGAERLDVQNELQRAVGGPCVTEISFDGTIVLGEDGFTYAKLLERFRENESWFEPRNCLPAGGLPDVPFIIRTSALTNFIGSLQRQTNQVDPSQDNVSDRLMTLNQASTTWWKNAHRERPDTHPTNKKVEEWLTERDFSPRLAKAGASIIRPNWAPNGRKSK